MGVQTGFSEGGRNYSCPLTRVSVKKASTIFGFKTFAYNKLNCSSPFAICFGFFFNEINTVALIQDGGFKIVDNKMENLFLLHYLSV